MTMLDPPPRSPIPVEQRIAYHAERLRGAWGELAEYVCQDCGETYEAGARSRSVYCRACRRRRELAQTAEHKRRKRAIAALQAGGTPR